MAEQFQPEPGARNDTWQSNQEEPECSSCNCAGYAEPYRRHQKDRDSHRLESRALNLLGPAAQAAPDRHYNTCKSRESAKRAVDKADCGICGDASTRGQFEGRTEECIKA